MDFSNCTVLVVDDFATMRQIVVGLLRQAGFGHVAEAEDGAQALRQLERSDFQLVVSDWNMPNMNGLELLKAVRRSAALQAVPFLLVTAESQKANIVDAAQAGADGYILKPFNANTLSKKIEGIFHRRELS
ncbi:MAG: response regulator [Rhodoferax sp.]|uniref:response regulator n=1 Tax=Rhodoferax sp. TaxID=50421 RepID=UPI00262BD825|nr:response regulator [Rhodoferax sp.]MDD2881848.1 response regulator [Rhodoferax sp.]